MGDISFMIVNSKLSHAVQLKSELESRVSFEVFQDNEEEDVWTKMEGGKDDVYIYDRCGRLAYFIPYPLSVMASADSLVPRAIISTYLQSPCGNTCGENGTDYESRMELTQHSDNTSFNDTVNDNHFLHNSSQNDIFQQNTMNSINPRQNGNNENTPQVNHSSNDIANLFFNSHLNNSSLETVNLNDTEHLDRIRIASINSSSSHNIDHSAHETTDAPTADRLASNARRKNDRCEEANIQVCNDFSKRKLLRILACCMYDNSDNATCRSFTPRRCKKMQTIIKCCIKTMISDATTTEVSTEPTTVASEVQETTNSDVRTVASSM